MILAIYEKYRPLCYELHMNGGNHKSADFGAIVAKGVTGMLHCITASREKYADNSLNTCCSLRKGKCFPSCHF